MSPPENYGVATGPTINIRRGREQYGVFVDTMWIRRTTGSLRVLHSAFSFHPAFFCYNARRDCGTLWSLVPKKETDTPPPVIGQYLVSPLSKRTSATLFDHLACFACVKYHACLTHEVHHIYTLEVGLNVVLLYRSILRPAATRIARSVRSSTSAELR